MKVVRTVFNGGDEETGWCRPRLVATQLGCLQPASGPRRALPRQTNTQKIERKHLTLRTRIKRLARKTICFSKTTQMHDIVLGLFVNRYAFGRAV